MGLRMGRYGLRGILMWRASHVHSLEAQTLAIYLRCLVIHFFSPQFSSLFFLSLFVSFFFLASLLDRFDLKKFRRFWAI